MDKKNITIMAMGYIGILIIVLGIVVTPSQSEMRDAELKTEYYGSGGGGSFYSGYDGYNNYQKALDDYDRLKRQQVVADHFVPIGLAMVLLTIPFAIFRYLNQDVKIPQFPDSYPDPRLRKPKDFLLPEEIEVEERR